MVDTRMRRAAIAIALAAVAFSSGSAQRAPVVWATDSSAACVGITVSISADTMKMQALVGRRWRVVSSKDGGAAASLFITKCPRSTVGGRRIGPAAIAAVILAAEPRGAMVAGTRMPVVALVLGEPRSPVAELFRTHAFAVRPATLTLTVDSSATPRRVTFAVVTPSGRIDGTAIVSDSSSVRSLNSRLSGADEKRISNFSGPEWMRRSSATATVRTTGTTLFSELGVALMPSTAIYDAGFGWRFAFEVKD